SVHSDPLLSLALWLSLSLALSASLSGNSLSVSLSLSLSVCLSPREGVIRPVHHEDDAAPPPGVSALVQSGVVPAPPRLQPAPAAPPTGAPARLHHPGDLPAPPPPAPGAPARATRHCVVHSALR